MDDILNLALRVFPKYMNIAFYIQNAYTVEPAGSHGAWSVDDYNLLPYVFGSAQLVGQTQIDVKDIFSREKVLQYQDKNMYFRMIKNINDMKSYEITTNSPFISEIHLTKGMSWEKINSGMLHHFMVEVLGKWPVIQHFWFGNILGFK